MSDIAKKRYTLLAKQIGEELGNARGWQSEAARRLGVHRTFISRILRDTQAEVSATIISRACERLHLDPRFFYEASNNDSYRSWIKYPTPKYSDPQGVRGYWKRHGKDRAYGDLLELLDQIDTTWALLHDPEQNAKIDRASEALKISTAILSSPHVVAARNLIDSYQAKNTASDKEQVHDALINANHFSDAVKRYTETPADEDESSELRKLLKEPPKR